MKSYNGWDKHVVSLYVIRCLFKHYVAYVVNYILIMFIMFILFYYCDPLFGQFRYLCEGELDMLHN